LWADYIIERFWKDNKFLKHTFDDSQYVYQGKYVIIPQPGSKPTVVKNRESLPATITRRNDSTVMYALDQFTTDPVAIMNADKYEISYDKIDSVIGDHIGELVEVAADDMIASNWLPSLPQANIVLTSGDSGGVILSGATGAKKKFTLASVIALKYKMDEHNVPKNDRFLLLSSAHEYELLADLSANSQRDFTSGQDIANGILGRYYGFTIMSRSNVARMSGTEGSSIAVKACGSLNAAGDRDCSIAWQKNALTHALGAVEFFENLQEPTVYGDVYSASLHSGGRRRRADNLGVYAIVQANA
jgi:hypothetical protein